MTNKLRRNPQRTPETRDPDRDFDCAHDSACAMVAAKANWPAFTCAKCDLRGLADVDRRAELDERAGSRGEGDAPVAATPGQAAPTSAAARVLEALRHGPLRLRAVAMRAELDEGTASKVLAALRQARRVRALEDRFFLVGAAAAAASAAPANPAPAASPVNVPAVVVNAPPAPVNRPAPSVNAEAPRRSEVAELRNLAASPLAAEPAPANAPAVVANAEAPRAAAPRRDGAMTKREQAVRQALASDGPLGRLEEAKGKAEELAALREQHADIGRRIGKLESELAALKRAALAEVAALFPEDGRYRSKVGSVPVRVAELFKSDRGREWSTKELVTHFSDVSRHSVEVALANLVKRAEIRRTQTGVYQAV